MPIGQCDLLQTVWTDHFRKLLVLMTDMNLDSTGHWESFL